MERLGVPDTYSMAEKTPQKCFILPQACGVCFLGLSPASRSTVSKA